MNGGIFLVWFIFYGVIALLIVSIILCLWQELIFHKWYWFIKNKLYNKKKSLEKEEEKADEKREEGYIYIKGARVKLKFLEEPKEFALVLLALKAYQLSGRRTAIAEKHIVLLDKIFKEKLDLGYKAVREEFLDKILEVVGKNILYRLKDSSIAIMTLYLLETEYTQEFPSSPVWIEEEFKTKQFRKAFTDAKIEFQEERGKEIKEEVEKEEEKDKVLEMLKEIKNKIGEVDKIYEKLNKISKEIQEIRRETKKTNEKKLETKKSKDFKTAQSFENELKEIELGKRDEFSAKLIGNIKRILATPGVKSETKQVLLDIINKALNSPKVKSKVKSKLLEIQKKN